MQVYIVLCSGYNEDMSLLLLSSNDDIDKKFQELGFALV